MKTQIHPTLALSLLAIGIFLGIALSVMAAWPDLEASFYGFSNQAHRTLPGLSCPILMTKDEVGIVKLKVTNNTDQKVSPTVRMEFSTQLVLATASESIQLAPGESRTLTWTVDAENIDLGKFIFAKALIYGAYPMPSRENTCGTYVLPVPGNGIWITNILTTLCLLCLGSGSFFLYKIEPPIKQANLFRLTAVIILLLLVISFLGWWLQTIFLLAILLLIIVIGLGTFIKR